jgi:hypothetical protein
MIDAGADIMYAERFGVSDAAKERGIKAIGNVIDTSADYPGTILASALWHMEPSVDAAIAAVLGDTYAAADYGKYSFMGEGGGSFVADAALVDPALLEKVKAVEADIKAGKFEVTINDEEPKSSM